MMKSNVRRAILGVFIGVGSQYLCAAPDWSQIPKRDLQVFHPGGATHEWVMMKSSHSGRTGLTKGESCIACHEGKTGLDIDLKKQAGKDLEPVGAPRTMIFPVSVQAADDDANLHKSGEAGKGATQSDGHVAGERVNKGGKAPIKAEGELLDGSYVVTFVRKLAGRNADGDLEFAAGQTIPFGIAIHADRTVWRFHHVSMGYTLGLRAPGDVKAVKQ